jgi:hypothetical protein
MLTPSKCVLVMYKSLVINMDDDMANNAFARNNYEQLCNCDTSPDIDVCVAHVRDSANCVQDGLEHRYFCLQFSDKYYFMYLILYVMYVDSLKRYDHP